MVDGNAIVQLQGTEMGDIQEQASAIVVIKAAGEGIGLRADSADVVKEIETQADATFLF